MSSRLAFASAFFGCLLAIGPVGAQQSPADPPAAAQPPSPPPAAPASPPPAAPPPAEQGTPAIVLSPEESEGIIGKNVRSAAGEDMGRIVDVIVTSGTQPRAAVIDFGGFLGVGSRKIAVDWRLLQYSRSGRNWTVTVAVPRSQLRGSPEYKPGEPVVVLTMPPQATASAAPPPPTAQASGNGQTPAAPAPAAPAPPAPATPSGPDAPTEPSRPPQ